MIAIDFGRWGDTQHSLTTFVFTSSAGGAAPPPTVQELVDSSIENWHAIDYRQRKRRRKLTPQEWAFIRQVLSVWRASGKRTLEELGVNTRLEKRFERAITPRRTITRKERNAARARLATHHHR